MSDDLSRGGPAYRFFAGKGGVGKTTCAAAHAAALATAPPVSDRVRVLAVSTDPAHSLADALEPAAATAPPAGLRVVEIAAAEAWERWLEPRREALRTIAERGTWLAPEEIASLLDLPVPGADELMGLLEVVRLAETADGPSTVVVDTAPTAHTLRLLDAPRALGRIAETLSALHETHHVLAEHFGGGDSGAREDAVIEELEERARRLGELIRDPDRARISWVLLPEELSLAETRDGLDALDAAGAVVDELVVDRLTPPPPEPCPVCAARRRAEAAVVGALRRLRPGLPVRLVPELDEEPRGPGALGLLAPYLRGERTVELAEAADEQRSSSALPPPGEVPGWLRALAPGGLRLLFFAGKGGVGKTTCAAATALLVAHSGTPERRRRVLLLSTDPAHSVADVLSTGGGFEGVTRRPVEAIPGLDAREVDAPAAFAAWRERHLDRVAEGLSALGRSQDEASSGADLPHLRRVVERLLDAVPPGLDELIAVLDMVEDLERTEPAGPQEPPDDPINLPDGPADHDLLVVDTAPTGHALRLLEMPGLALDWDHALLRILHQYRRMVARVAALTDLATELVALSRRLRRFRALLADPARTRVAVVTRPGELPERETVRLVRALDERGLALGALIANAAAPSSAPPPGRPCSRCRRGAEAESRALDRLRRELSGRADGAHRYVMLRAPARYPPPRGAGELLRWARGWSADAAERVSGGGGTGGIRP